MSFKNRYGYWNIQTEALYNIHVQLIFYQLKEEHKRQFHFKYSVKWLYCENVRTCCQSKESIFIDRQQSYITVYSFMDGWTFA